MYNLASEEFIEQINQPSRKFHCILDFYDFQITDGFELTYYGGADSNNQLSIGSTVSAYVELRIEKTTNILENKEFEVKIGLEIEKDGEVTVEYVPLGVFRTPKTIDDDYSVYFTAYDRMVDFSTPFNSEEVFNHDITMQTLMEWICGDTNGIPYVELPAHIATLTLGDVYYAPWLLGKTLKEVFSGHTKREIIGWIACMCAGYAYVDKIGVLHIISWSTDVERIALDYDVISSFDKGESDYTVTKVIGKKSYLNADAYSELHTSDKEYSAGDGITGISFQMPFTNQNVVDLIYEQISYFTYRGADVTFMGNPLLEQNDVLEVTDMSGKVYIIPCMRIVHNFDGGLSTTVVATASEQDNIVYSDPNNSQSLYQQVAQIAMALPKKASFEQLEVEIARIDYLEANSLTIEEADIKYAQIEEIEAIQADIKQAVIEDLSAEFITVDALEATNARVTTLETTSLTADSAIIQSLTTEVAKIGTLEADNVDIKDRLTATEANIGILETEKLSAKDIEGKYANIDFSNIGKAAMEYFYAQSGLIENVEVGGATITGNLVGVTIKGDLIEGNTIVAEKLVIKGEDGLYYKLNTDGVKTETEQTDYNSLNGSIITAKSITATKISVKDLVAFDATIGGFNITENSLYSGVKESVNNTTRGVYLDNDGQIAFGDASNYIKYYKDTDNSYKLAISAESITFSATGKNIEDTIDTAVKDSVDNIEIGGRNSIILSTLTEGYRLSTAGTLIVSTTSCVTANIEAQASEQMILTIYKSFTFDSNTFVQAGAYAEDGTFISRPLSITTTSIEARTSWSFVTPENTSYIRIVFPIVAKDDVKLERGNKSTDWTPAPEDVQQGITNAQTTANNASKVATNYMSFSDNGLIVGNMTASELGRNVLIDADSVDIRNGTTVLASYGDNEVYLGKNNESAVIDFCSGSAQMKQETEGWYYPKFIIDAPHWISLNAENEIGLNTYYSNSAGSAIASIDVNSTYGLKSLTSATARAAITMHTSTNSTKVADLALYDGKAEIKTSNASNDVEVILNSAENSIKLKSAKAELDGNLYLQNNMQIAGENTSGSFLELLKLNANNNLIVGYGGWVAGVGSTNIYGNNISFAVKSANAYLKPYYAAGDVINANSYTAGYVSNGSVGVYFEIPLAKPVIGNPSLAVANVSGLIIRQAEKYTHGSSVSAGAVPSSMSATLVRGGNAVRVVATMSSSTNAVNNDACGIHYNLQILFS